MGYAIEVWLTTKQTRVGWGIPEIMKIYIDPQLGFSKPNIFIWRAFSLTNRCSLTQGCLLGLSVRGWCVPPLGHARSDFPVSYVTILTAANVYVHYSGVGYTGFRLAVTDRPSTSIFPGLT